MLWRTDTAIGRKKDSSETVDLPVSCYISPFILHLSANVLFFVYKKWNGAIEKAQTIVLWLSNSLLLQQWMKLVLVPDGYIVQQALVLNGPHNTYSAMQLYRESLSG